MDSPGHRRNILNPWHRKANIGIDWDGYNLGAVRILRETTLRLPTIEAPY